MADPKKIIDLELLGVYDEEVDAREDEKIEALADGAVKDNTDAIALLNDADATKAGTIAKSVKDAVDALDGELAAVAKSGNASDVTIADEAEKLSATTVEGALAELATKIENANSAGKVTVESVNDDTYAKVYSFYQGVTADDDDEVKATKKIGVINIPKDVFVKEGTVVEVSDSEAGIEGFPADAGVYIKVLFQNQDTPCWIPANSLIEYVTGGETSEITVVVDETTHIVTATVKKIAASKIVYKTKEVDGETVDVTVESALDDIYVQIGEGGSVETQITSAIEDLDATVSIAPDEGEDGISVSITETDGKLTAVTASVSLDNTYDAKGSASQALSDAKDYTEDYADPAGTAATVKSEILGSADDDTKDSLTIQGVRKYADDAAANAVGGLVYATPEEVRAIFSKEPVNPVG